MFSLLAIPLVDAPTTVQTLQSASSMSVFFSRPFDVILYDIFIWTGWIPIAFTLAWGFVQMWQNNQQGKFASSLKYTLLAIDIPSMTEQSPKALENLFAGLYGAKSGFTWKETWIIGKLQAVFSFEIISSEGYIQFLIRTQTKFRDVIEAGIYAHYPDAEINEVEDYTKDFPIDFPNDDYDMWGSELTLDRDDYYPIRTYVDFEDRLTGEIKDPLGYTLEQMAKMRPGEHFWIQILVQPKDHDWAKKGVAKLNALYGKKEKVKVGPVESAFKSVVAWPVEFLNELAGVNLAGWFGLAVEEVKKDPMTFLPLQETKEAEAIFNKISKVGLGTKIRILYVGRQGAFAKGERAIMVKGILNQYASLSLNKFTLWGPATPKDDYFWLKWSYASKQKVLMQAYKKRSFGIGANQVYLNAEELASLWHFPTINFKAPLVKKSEAKRAEPPVGLPITFLEDTLPGYTPSSEPTSHLPMAPDFPVESLPETFSPTGEPTFDAIGSAAVPKVKSPTKDDTIDESFTPPNLPI